MTEWCSSTTSVRKVRARSSEKLRALAIVAACASAIPAVWEIDVNASTPAAPDGIGLSSPIRETLFVATRSVELVFGPTDRCEPLAPLKRLPGQAVCPLWVVINGPDGPEIRLPLFPRRRTQVGHRAMSVSCQQQTWLYSLHSRTNQRLRLWPIRSPTRD